MANPEIWKSLTTAGRDSILVYPGRKGKTYVDVELPRKYASTSALGQRLKALFSNLIPRRERLSPITASESILPPGLAQKMGYFYRIRLQNVSPETLLEVERRLKQFHGTHIASTPLALVRSLHPAWRSTELKALPLPKERPGMPPSRRE